MRQMTQTLRSTFGRLIRGQNRRANARRGRLERLSAFHSAILGNDRDLTVYLPPGYDEHPDVRYPVLYMNDGQNLFEAERAFIPGQHWRVADAADDAIARRFVQPLIIVGIDNAGSARIDEYTPSHDEGRGAGGRAPEYVRMLVEEVKPLIDARYRTRSEAAATGLAGSSLGGLVTLYAGLTRAESFSRLGVLSPSVWWDGESILRFVDAAPPRRGVRLWVDVGSREGAEALSGARKLRERLRRRGWSDSVVRYVEENRADHSERAWMKRFPAVLEYLYPIVEE